MHLKNEKRGRIKQYAQKYNVRYIEGGKPWSLKCNIALPCATQNEINVEDAETLVKNGCECVAEGANKPIQPDAIKFFLNNKILLGPGKAVNAGGVAVSGLEMSQNEMWIQWLRPEVDERLQSIMSEIHDACVTYGDNGTDYINYVRGANVAGFIKVADSMLHQGVV